MPQLEKSLEESKNEHLLEMRVSVSFGPNEAQPANGRPPPDEDHSCSNIISKPRQQPLIKPSGMMKYGELFLVVSEVASILEGSKQGTV